METYLVKADWPALQEFIKHNLEAYDKQSFGIMHKDGTIIIRSTTYSIINLLKKKFEMAKTEQPKNFLEGDNGWSYFGNHYLFDIRL